MHHYQAKEAVEFLEKLNLIELDRVKFKIYVRPKGGEQQ